MAKPEQIRILIIDDSNLMQNLISHGLQKFNPDFIIDKAGSGEEGIEKIKGAAYTLLVLDYNLPGKSGLETLQWLRANQYNLPVIMVTSKGNAKVVSNALELNVIAYLIKDNKGFVDEIIKAVKKVIGQTSVDEQKPDAKIHILLVDNNHRDRKKLEEGILANLNNYAIDLVSDGNDCTSTLRNTEYDALIIDYNLPGRNGLEVLKYIKETGLNLPVIMTTIIGDEQVASESIQLGVQRYVLKEGNYIQKILSHLSDIVEKTTLRKRIEEFHNMYNQLVEKEKDIIYTLDISGNFTALNSAVEKNLAYLPEELLGKSLFDLVSEAEKPQMYNDFNYLLEKGDIIGQTVLVDKNGREHNVEYSSTVIKQRDSITGIRGIIRDITDEIRYKATLIEEKKYTENIINSMVDALFVINPMGMIKTVNKATLDLLGYADNELIGEHINSLFEKGEFLFNDFRNISKDRNFKSYDLSIKTKKGRCIPVSFLLSLMQNDGEKSLNIIGIARDMREKLELEAQLIQSEKLSALGELTAGIAHELNQPLNGIKIVCQSLLRDIEKDRFEQDDLTKDLKTIISQIDKMSKIITHMRIFTRKSDTMTMQPLNLNEIISNALLFLEQQLYDHNIKLTKSLSAGLAMIQGDPIRLEQIFVNLITNAQNALNAVKDGREKIICISTRQENDFVVSEIEDNGMGIPGEIIEKIFQPFFTTMEPGKGTGLGLSVTSKIVAEHQGTIAVDSTVGKGSVFRLKLAIRT